MCVPSALLAVNGDVMHAILFVIAMTLKNRNHETMIYTYKLEEETGYNCSMHMVLYAVETDTNAIANGSAQQSVHCIRDIPTNVTYQRQS